jgi:hypothetical protein
MSSGDYHIMMKKPLPVRARQAVNETPVPFALSLGVVVGLIGLLVAWFI